eukprot:scaffold403580_cov18-Prasinocladus_malaysianus.AAC.1
MEILFHALGSALMRFVLIRRANCHCLGTPCIMHKSIVRKWPFATFQPLLTKCNVYNGINKRSRCHEDLFGSFHPAWHPQGAFHRKHRIAEGNKCIAAFAK